MNTQVAITLSEQVYQQAQRLAQLTDCEVSELLADAVTLSLAPVEVSGEPGSAPSSLLRVLFVPSLRWF